MPNEDKFILNHIRGFFPEQIRMNRNAWTHETEYVLVKVANTFLPKYLQRINIMNV